MPSIKVILARSPFQIIINEANQIATKVELRLWNKGDTKPTNPTYIMSEGIASVTQRQTNYNISPFILEFIDKFKLQYDINSVIQADNKEWCIGEYKTFYKTNDLDFTLISTVSFCAVNGFSTVEQGLNFDVANTNQYLLLANPNIKVYWNIISPYYNFICKDTTDEFTAKWYNDKNTLLNTQKFYTGVNEFFNYSIPLVYGLSAYVIIESKNNGTLYKIDTEEICEPKYPIQTMWFVNKLGGWNQFNFFKASYNSINVKNSDYSLMQKEVNYDYRRGQTKPFNINGNGSIKVNTGWVTEDYYEWIEQMMLSDTILLNPQTPVTIKTTSMEKKTYLKDKNINYTLEFEFANKLVNNIV
jgi:hypothetical protein